MSQFLSSGGGRRINALAEIETLFSTQLNDMPGVTVQHINRRGNVFEPGDPETCIYLIRFGRVRLYRHAPSGKEITVALYDIGELFGEMAVFYPSRRINIAATMEDTELIMVPTETFKQWMNEQPRVKEMVLFLLADRRRAMEQKVADLVSLEVPQRVAQTILWLFERYNPANPVNHPINARLTHHELASLAGTTRETATLILNRFRKQGLIDFSGRRLVVKDQDGLIERVNTPGD